MSRTSTALRRLGVAGLAAVTIGAGVPALVSTAAQAATGPVTRVVLTPETASAPSGTCVEYTAQARNAAGDGVATATITVALSEGTSATATGVSATFCNPDTGADVTSVNNTNGQRTAVFEANANGFVTFGVVDRGFDSGTGSGAAANNVVLVTAFSDTNNDRIRNGNEPFDDSTQTTTRPSTANDVDTVDATPETATNVVGEAHVIRVTTTNSSGTATAGITVNFTVTGVNAQTTRACDAPTNSIGQTTCTYTGTNVGNDAIRVFVNQTAASFNSTNERDAAPGGATGFGEPFDDVAKTYIAAQANRTIDVTCLADTTDPTLNSEESAGACTNVIPDTNRTFRAVVGQANTSSTASTTNTLVRFTVTGGSGDETITIANGTQTPGGGAGDCTTADNTGTTTTADSFCDVVVNDPTPRVGQVLTVTATIRGTNPAVSDSATLTFRNSPSDARFITVTPDGGETLSEGVRVFTARVTDADGNPVRGVTVKFTENGTASAGFIRGSDTDVTDNNGEATVEVTSGRNETGTATITGTIDAATTQCDEARGAGTDPEGGNTGSTTAAGNCTDNGTTTFVTSFSSPSQSPPQSPSGQPSTPPGCATAAAQNPNIQIRVNTPTINATGLASVTATGAQPGQVIELQGYSQNHFGTRNFNNDPTPVDRTAVADSNGSATFNNLRPASNTRVRARQRGCAFGNIGAVINVRTQITLQVVRNGVRTYTFSGRTIPAREGGLIVTLYRGASEVLFRQTRATPGSDVQPQPAGAGLYSIRVTFPAREANTTQRFVVKTGQDAQNAPGRSNARFLRVF